MKDHYLVMKDKYYNDMNVSFNEPNYSTRAKYKFLIRFDNYGSDIKFNWLTLGAGRLWYDLQFYHMKLLAKSN